ncbi:ribokinase-like [Planococcus citri]|uniref:ribokinase-like n=1 Tax=Planococcus citri TaxID=170843 RepID=UPI0031F7E671
MSKEIDVLVIGSCMTDLIAYTERLPRIGETIHGQKFSIGFGGKGANQCIAAAKLGAHAALVAKLGNDSFGTSYMQHLKDEKIDVSCVRVVDCMSGVAQICVDKSGENNIIIIAGANDTLNLNDVIEAKHQIEKSKVVMFQFETPLETTVKALELCKTHHCTTIVNAAPAASELDQRIFHLSDVFCANETETEMITNERIESIADAKKAALKLKGKGCKRPVITLGSRGAVFLQDESEDPIYVPVDAVKAVDTTGAGDAFLGAMAFFLSSFSNLSFETVVKYSCEAARCSVLKAGTQTSFPTANDLPRVFQSLQSVGEIPSAS